ncbi:MAG: DUF1203 domain-containing protein [Bacteroidota bacterium]
MQCNFQVLALDATSFAPLFQLTDAELAERGMRRQTVDQKPGYPCRVSLQDADLGEKVILLPYAHHTTKAPYRASGPIYVRKDVPQATLPPNELPRMLSHRLLSIRAYDANGMMIQAKVEKGDQLRPLIQQLLQQQAVHHLDVHNAGPGCYNCRIERMA